MDLTRSRFQSLVFLWAGVTLSETALARPMSVCAALERSTELDGQNVTIRGLWMWGMEHVGIYPYQCTPREQSVLAAIRITSKGTNAGLEAASKEFKRLRQNLGKQFAVVATFRGQLN